jgi:hypothetical protein
VLFNLEGLSQFHYRWEYEPGRVFDNFGWFALSAIWVKITGTEERTNALSVAHHSKNGKLSSFREVTSRKQAGLYFSAPKYLTKEDDEEVPEGESIGRCWFVGGSPERSEGDIFDLNADEMVLLRRYLRRYTERRSRFWSRLIAKKHNRISVFMDRETAYNLLLWIRYELGLRTIEGVPF